MYCCYCGKEIPDGAGFCAFCGKLVAQGAESPAQTSPQPEAHNVIPGHEPIRFTIHGHTLEYDWRFEEYVKHKKEFRERFWEFFSPLYESTDKTFSNLKGSAPDDSLDLFADFGQTTMNWLANEIHQTLLREKIYDVNMEQINTRLGRQATAFLDAYEKLFNQYSAVIASAQELEQYRAAQRVARGRWQGGGFGVKGAVKGAMTAGALNIGTGMIRGIGDMFVNSSDRSKILKQKKAVLEGQDWSDVFLRGLLKDHNVAFSILMDLLEKGEKISLPNLSGVGERCNTLMQNAHKVSDRKERLELALQAVHLYPFATEPYHLLLEQYGFVDADTLNVFAYFQDDARQKALQRKIQENFCSVLDGMPEQTYEELETKLDYIKNHQQRVAKGKAACPMLEAYEREYRSEWKKTYQEIRKRRLTSPDGILFDSPEKMELYEAERERLQPYRAALTSSDKYDTLRDLYEAGQKADFRSKEAKDVLEQLGARIKAFDTIRKEYKNSLKDYFRRTWDREIDRNELPAYAREYLRSLPEAPLCAILSVYTTKVCDPQSSPQDGCIIVSDFFIAVVCSRSGGTSIPIDKIKAISRDVLGFAFSLDTDNSQRGSERKRVSFHLDYTESSARLEKFMDELSLHFSAARNAYNGRSCSNYGTQVDLLAEEKKKLEADFKKLKDTYRIEDPGLTLERIKEIRGELKKADHHPAAVKQFEKELKGVERRLTSKIQVARMEKKIWVGFINTGVIFLAMLFVSLVRICGNAYNSLGLIGLVLRGGEGIGGGTRFGVAIFLALEVIAIIEHAREIINGMTHSDAQEFTYADMKETMHGMTKGFGGILFLFLCVFVASWLAGDIVDSTWALIVLAIVVLGIGISMQWPDNSEMSK